MLDKQTIENTLEAIKRTADYEYFFSKIEIPDWILPLREAGFFFKPPKVQEEGRYLKHPSWPESSYLLRMAAKAPEIVCETILKVSKTDNERVHQDYVEAACKMPPNYALKIAKKELEWIKSHDHFYFLYPKTIGALISHLAKNGQQGVAEALTISILDITVIDREYGKPGDEWYGKTTEI